MGDGRNHGAGAVACEALQALTPDQAAPHLLRCAEVGRVPLSNLIEAGQAYRLTAPGGRGVFVLERVADQLWVAAAQSEPGAELLAAGFAAVEKIARATGCTSVGFRTRRAGLIRQALRAGFSVDSAELSKALT